MISEGGIIFPGQDAVASEGLIRATWVLVRRDGNWLIASYHNSPASFGVVFGSGPLPSGSAPHPGVDLARPERKEQTVTMTQYMALLYYDRNQYWDAPQEAGFAPDYTEFARRAIEAGVMRGGEALHPVTMSTTITVSGGKGGDVLLVDGPYAEAKEVLGGYFLLEVDNLDEAIAWAAQNPGAWRGRSSFAR